MTKTEQNPGDTVPLSFKIIAITTFGKSLSLSLICVRTRIDLPATVNVIALQEPLLFQEHGYIFLANPNLNDSNKIPFPQGKNKNTEIGFLTQKTPRKRLPPSGMAARARVILAESRFRDSAVSGFILVPLFLGPLTRFLTREILVVWLHQMFLFFSGVKFSVLRQSTVFLRRIHCHRFVSTQIGVIMKLYSDRGNPMLLRILAAKNLAGVPLAVEYINYEGKCSFLYLRKRKRKK